MNKVPISDIYEIKQIDYKTAMDLVVTNHYLHRKAPCTYAFGLIQKENNQIVGVVTYGKPASPSLCKGICGPEESKNVIELTRLWIKDDTPKNVESFLISHSLKLVPFSIIVSFADTSEGHLGIVYQATNWIYTGLSDKHVQWKYVGQGNVHSRHWAKDFGGDNNAKKILGDDLIREERPRKHRYIMFNCPRVKRKFLMRKLRYKQIPYPKNNTGE